MSAFERCLYPACNIRPVHHMIRVFILTAVMWLAATQSPGEQQHHWLSATAMEHADRRPQSVSIFAMLPDSKSAGLLALVPGRQSSSHACK
jgi:hypothetical protein